MITGNDPLGHLLILLALSMNLLAAVTFFLAARGKDSLQSLAIRSYHAFVGLAGIAFAYLYYLFLTHDYSIKYVYEYNERSQPFFYVISGVWGGQEGTYLMWLLLSGLFGYIVYRYGGRHRLWAMGFYTVLNLFLLSVLVRLSPFAYLPSVAADGLGLNPLLRDPWMVIHPPVMFLGYALVGVPFVMALTALFRHDYYDWQTRAFPWVALSALLLGLGNVLGAYWAYKTLGWGGYWGWDPVENSSLIPWLISLALLHGLILEKRTGALRRINLLLSMMLFLAVVYGTFLTRSGVLADFSVHSFGDLGVTGYLVGFLVFFTLVSIVTLVVRARTIPTSPLNYNYYGTEFSVFAGMALLSVMAAVVLFWTSLPLLSTAFSDTPRAANIETYNTFAMPLAMVMAFLISLTSVVRTDGHSLSGWVGKLIAAFAVSSIVGLGLYFVRPESSAIFVALFVIIATGLIMALFLFIRFKPIMSALVAGVSTAVICAVLEIGNDLYVLCFSLAAMVLVANGIVVAERLSKGAWRALGGQLTHLGYGILLAGVLASSAFVTSDKLIIPEGESRESFGLAVIYRGMENEITHPKNRLLLTLSDGDRLFEGRPELYYSQRMDGIMRKPYIDRTLSQDVYMAPSQVLEAETADFILRKGQTRETEDFSVTFEDFSIGDHGMGGGMSVAARLTINHADSSFEIAPVLSSQTTTEGTPEMVEQPGEFTLGDRQYSVSIERIIADEGAVKLSIPNLSASALPEQLVLDVSRIPLINLVWVGTTLILLGTLITFLRRRSEAVRLPRD